MAVTDTTFQPRATIATAYATAGATDKEKLQMQVWLDIRDLLSRISVASSVGEAVIVEAVEENK